MSHTRGGWYQECTRHPEPDDDAPLDVRDDWNDKHFYVGDAGILTCEENRLYDICLECTQRRQDREEDDEVRVRWHGARSARDDQGRFVGQAMGA